MKGLKMKKELIKDAEEFYYGEDLKSMKKAIKKLSKKELYSLKKLFAQLEYSNRSSFDDLKPGEDVGMK